MISAIGLSPQAMEAMQAEAWQEAKRRVNLQKRLKAEVKARNYQPRGAAAELFAYQGREVLISGPAGTGKSRAALEKINQHCIEYPGIRVLMCRKTRASMSESVLVTFEDKVLGSDNPMVADGPQRTHRHSYQYPTGSEIVIGGLDKPSRLMSTEFDIIYIAEANETELTDLESLSTRLRNFKMPYQQLIADTNPDHPNHYLKKRADSGAIKMLYSVHKDNPRLWDAEKQAWTPEGVIYLATLEALSGVRKDRLYYGKWVQAEGAVYDQYNESIHLMNRFEIPRDWRRFRVIDFGYTNPFVCQWWAQDHDGRLYLYREIYMSQRTVASHAAQIKELSAGEVFDRPVIADHDAEDRATLAAAGIQTKAAAKDISTGIQAVQERLKVAGDGKPRLFILRDSLVERDQRLADLHRPTCTQDEFTGYIWPKGIDGKAVKESPIKENDHGMDAMRYLVKAVDGKQPLVAKSWRYA